MQDNLAHLIAIESVLLDRPRPEHHPPDRPHIRNDVGRENEVWVDWFRVRSGPEVLDAFRKVTAARLDVLRAPDYDFGADSWTPMGPGTVGDLLPFRIFDCFTHEQDMRRAVHRPGGWDGIAAGIALGNIRRALPMIVGKKVAPPDGTVVAFAVDGPAGFSVAFALDGRRAVSADGADPTVRLTMSADTFLRLGAGRGDSRERVAAGDVVLTGDTALGERVVDAMNVLF